MALNFSGPVFAKQAQIITSMLKVGTRCLWSFAMCGWFSSNLALYLMSKHLHLGLVCPKDIVFVFVIGFVQMQVSKLKYDYMLMFHSVVT